MLFRSLYDRAGRGRHPFRCNHHERRDSGCTPLPFLDRKQHADMILFVPDRHLGGKLGPVLGIPNPRRPGAGRSRPGSSRTDQQPWCAVACPSAQQRNGAPIILEVHWGHCLWASLQLPDELVGSEHLCVLGRCALRVPTSTTSS